MAIGDVLVVAVVDYICGGCGVIKARWRLISSTWHCNHTLHCTQATALRNAPQMIKGQGCKKVNSNSWYTTWYSGRSSCIDASKWTMQWWRIVCTTMRELRSHNGWWWNFGLCPLALLIRWSAADQVRSPVISSAAAHYRSCTHTRAVIRAAASIQWMASTPFFRVEHGRGDWWVRALNWGLIGQEFPAWPPNILTKLWYHVARKWWLEHLTSILEEYICYEFSCGLNPNISNPRKYTKVSKPENKKMWMSFLYCQSFARLICR